MKIGIISDTHDQIEQTQKAIAVFNAQKVGMVIHCGDIVSPFMLQFYKELNCPIKFLFGNNAGDIWKHLVLAEKFGLADYEFGTFFSIQVGGKRIATYHGENKEITEALIKCGDYDCVFSGHDHVSRIEKIGKVLFVNPGTLVDEHTAGITPPSVAVYETETGSAEIIEVI